MRSQCKRDHGETFDHTKSNHSAEIYATKMGDSPKREYDPEADRTFVTDCPILLNLYDIEISL